MPLKIAYAREKYEEGSPKLLGHVLAGFQQRHDFGFVPAIEDEVKLDEEPDGWSDNPKRVNPGIPV